VLRAALGSVRANDDGGTIVVRPRLAARVVLFCGRKIDGVVIVVRARLVERCAWW
jgi:hypothetical protein